MTRLRGPKILHAATLLGSDGGAPGQLLPRARSRWVSAAVGVGGRLEVRMHFSPLILRGGLCRNHATSDRDRREFLQEARRHVTRHGRQPLLLGSFRRDVVSRLRLLHYSQYS